jgi:uncharacterized protein YhaN
MRIRSFHIDGFGVFSDLAVPALSPGLNIFLGDNESGKSTCLDFFRFMLFGYPQPNSREASRAPLNGGEAGGFLLLDTLRLGAVRLTRRPGRRGGLKLGDQDGKPLEPGLLDTVMAGVTREVYRNVFAFSLSELQSFQTLSAPAVRNALYGASFGTGLRSPAAVLKELDERLGGIHAPRRSSAALNKAVAERNALVQKLQEAQRECADFDALSARRRETEEQLRALRGEQETGRLERRNLERRLGVWRQWEEWRKAGMALARLHPFDGNFPPDGPARLERARERREAAGRRARAQEEKTARMRAECEALPVDEKLLSRADEPSLLAERKGACRNALGVLPALNAALTRAEEELARLLGNLGPGWDCDRVRATNRSLFAREELERQAREMDAAEQARNAAAMQLQRINRDVEAAKSEFEGAEEHLESLPIPTSAPDEDSRERLRRILPLLEENSRRCPERMQALHAARSTAIGSAAPLRLGDDAPENVLDLLIQAQNEAQKLADDVEKRIRAAAEVKLAADRAQTEEERSRSRADHLLAGQRESRNLTRDALDSKGAALRSLRQVSASLTQEITRLAELDERMGLPAPAPVKSPLLTGCGLTLAALGLCALLARWLFDVTTLTLGPELVFPLSSWSSYLVVVAGALLLAAGLPRSGREVRRHREEADRLRERRDGTARRIAELEEQAQKLCLEAGLSSGAEIVSPDNADALNAAETHLDREREELAAAERMRSELEILQNEHAEARERARVLEHERAQAEAAVQQARRRWHEYFQNLYVETVPSPESAAAFFARVEAARLARDNERSVERELRELVEQSAALAREARDLLPPGEISDAGETRVDDVLPAVRHVLDMCREADARAEERAGASAAAHSARVNLARLENMQDENAGQMREAEKRLEAARAVWRESLVELGLGGELSPGTVREALECMERCLNAEAEAARLRDEIARLEKDRDALLLPLSALLQSLGREPLPGVDGLPDWPASLDLLLNASRNARNAAEEREMLKRRVREEEEALRAALADLEAEKRTENELLASAGVDNAEDFLRLAEAEAEREALIRRRRDLEDALLLASGDAPFEKFTASFAETDEEEHKARLAALEALLADREQKERGLVDELGSLNARLAALEAAAEEFASLRQQEAALQETLRRLTLEFCRYALARRLIGEAKQNFERKSQPAVIRAASSIFAEITEQAWTGLSASLDDDALSVLPQHKEAVSPEQLSRGAQEQLYLALRLAYIRNHAAHASALPVIMDDILVNFDPARAKNTALALVPLVKGLPPSNGQNAIPPHQVLFFTCHPHQAEMLQSVVPDSLLLKVAKGKILAARPGAVS